MIRIRELKSSLIVSSGVFSVIAALTLYAWSIYRTNDYRLRLQNHLIYLEANLETRLSAGETRQTLTYLHADKLRAGRRLTSRERTDLQTLMLLLTAHQLFLEQYKSPWVKITSAERAALDLLPDPSAAYTSPQAQERERLKAELRGQIELARARGEYSSAATALDLIKDRPSPPPSPQYYDPKLATDISSKQILQLTTRLRTSLDSVKLTF